MSDKYIKQDSGLLKEVEATSSSAGAANAGDIIALDSGGKIDNSLLPTGIGADTALVEASENLAAGDYVNIYDDSGSFKCRKADATTNGKPAHGFVLDTVTSGSNATIYFEGSNNQLSGLTAGLYFLDTTTAGGVVATAPSLSGNIVQRVGIANNATTINTEIGQPIELA